MTKDAPRTSYAVLVNNDIRTTMARDLREELRADNREHYRRWKAEHGVVSPFDVEGFAEALEEEYLMGYSLADIGMMYGVSRERVRQWFEKEGIGHGDKGASLRVWDEDMDCFVPVSREEYADKLARRYEKKLAYEREEARRETYDAIRALRSELGRPPYLGEIADRVERGPPSLAYAWGYNHNNPDQGECGSYAAAWDRMYAAAGMEYRYRQGGSPTDRPIQKLESDPPDSESETQA